MPTVIVASTNPVKINAAKNAFAQMFPGVEFTIEGQHAPSGVPDQPMGTEETVRGAQNRVAFLRHARPDADYWVGIEGGILTDDNGTLVSQAWIVIASKDGRESVASTGTFVLPEIMAKGIREGKEMGHVTDGLHGFTNSKQQGGTIGVLTHGVIDRTAYYTHAAILALIPFKNPELY